jgi:hypothetical protein
MQVSSVGNRVAYINPDAKTNGAIRALVVVVEWTPLLHLYGAAHRTIDAIENNKERVAAGLNDPTRMFVYRRVDYACAY